MPKIALRYTGGDEAITKRLEASDGIQLVEPIDAREILATPDCEYEIDEESRKQFGMQYDPRLFGANAKPGDEAAKPEDEGKVNIPQLHGMDAELQTGLSAEKYGRSQVVKAVPDGSQPTATMPMSTMGRSLVMDERRDEAVAAKEYQKAPEQGKSSEGMTADEMREALKAKNVQFPPDAKKAELAELVDRHNAGA